MTKLEKLARRYRVSVPTSPDQPAQLAGSAEVSVEPQVLTKEYVMARFKELDAEKKALRERYIAQRKER